MTEQITNELTIDVAVIGSGAAGFAAALTARNHGADVHIFEAADYFGGTTALSGGVAWLPGNHLMASTGGDSADDALNYLRHHVGNRSDEVRMSAFVSRGPEMLKFFVDKGYVQVGRMESFPDYHAETAGADPGENYGGRSVEPLVFSGKKLGDWLPKMRRRPITPPIIGTMSELRRLAAIRTDFFEFIQAWRAIPRTFWGKLTGAQHLASGGALIGRLAHAAKNEGISLHLAASLKSLNVENDRVQSLLVEQNNETLQINVRQGVILASGGFDHNQAMRDEHLGTHAAGGHPAGASSNTGGGHIAASEAGAVLSNMDNAWWAPVCLIPGAGPSIVIFERGKPGQIVVDQNGQRFTNEAQPYGKFVQAMLEAHETSKATVPAFMVFDQTFRDRYPIGHLLPGITPQSDIESGFLTKADSLADLASSLEIDATALEATVSRFNEMATRGKDEDFGRGDYAFDRYSGDRTVTPNPCLAPIRTAPFYAVKIYPGDLGTNGGVLTNEFAQALDDSGQPIEGLYAAGNCAASVLGGFYPGAGGTIGPAMTFAYIAANHLCKD